MKTLLYIVALFFTIALFSQKVAGLPFWFFAGGYAKHSSSISLPDSYSGTVTYKNNDVSSKFSIKSNYIFNDSLKINLDDKDLTTISLSNSVNKLKLRRVKDGNYLKRILVDTLGFSVYDTKFDFDTSHVRKYQLLFSYNDKLYYIRQNIFRSFQENFDRTIADINITDEELKNVIAKFYATIENK